MVEIIKRVKRGGIFWQGINEETVGTYQGVLEEDIEALETLTWTQGRLLGIGDHMKNEIFGLLKDELNLCCFYFEHIQRQKEENFDKWFFVKQEDRKTILNELDWRRREGDCWVRYNGKTQATITLDTSGMMTKISLRLDDNAEALVFLDHCIHIASSHLKNAESIKQRIAEYKALAEEKMEEYKYPRYCPELAEIGVLKGMLHVEEASK